LGMQGGAPHTRSPPPPPHVWLPEQVPHWSVFPQPSPMGPQLTAWAAQLLGVQLLPVPHTLAVPPPPQVSPGTGQVAPQSIWLPQPSPTGPQSAPSSAHVFGVHTNKPHTPGVLPPPHVSGAVQVPQSSVPPQPSPIGPHCTPWAAHVVAPAQVAPSPPPSTSMVAPVDPPPPWLPVLEEEVFPPKLPVEPMMVLPGLHETTTAATAPQPARKAKRWRMARTWQAADHEAPESQRH